MLPFFSTTGKSPLLSRSSLFLFCYIYIRFEKIRMKQQTRPLLLSSALLLSVIGSSIATLAYFTAAVLFDRTRQIIEKLTNIQTPQKIAPLYFVIYGALYCLSLIGVLKMMKSQKTGYFFYTSAQISLLIVPLLWMGFNSFSATNAIFTILFITIYSYYLSVFK